jgi:ABC-2 type transport system ATP-binding protein
METLLACRGLRKRFGETTALAGVDLTVAAGEVRGLVGANGAGKSTLLRCVLGLARPDAGEIELLGRRQAPSAGHPLDGVAGLVDGTRWPTGMRVRSVLRMLAAYDAVPTSRIDDVMEQVSLTGLARQRVGALSLGGRQRLGIAACLLRDPRLLLLDEPVNGLDPTGRRDLRRLLRDLSAAGAAVVISSHDLTEIAATCDSVTRLDRGTASWTAAIDEVPATSERQARIATSDDGAAASTLAEIADLRVNDAEDGLGLAGSADALDEASLALGRAGIAIRRWERREGLAAAMLPSDPDESTP